MRPVLRQVLRGAATGALLGAGWGCLARVWMRTVSTDPAFTWSGTLFVVGVMAVAGLLVGVVRALRLAGAPSACKVLLLPALLAFGGAGLLLLPGALVGGWGLSGRGPVWLRRVAVGVAVVVVPLLVWFVATPAEDRAVLVGPVVVVGLALVQGLLAWAAAEVFRPHAAVRPGEVPEVRAGAAIPATR